MTEALEDYPITVEWPVAWGEMDAYQHVNNAQYFRYFESARIAYFEHMGIVEGGGDGVGPILATAQARFRAPVVYPDRLVLGARVSQLGVDRFTMEYAVWSRALERVACEGQALVVSYDYVRGAKVDLPQAWQSRIAEIEGRRPPP